MFQEFKHKSLEEYRDMCYRAFKIPKEVNKLVRVFKKYKETGVGYKT